MIPQAIGFFGWKRPQIAAKTLAALARCPGIERWPLIAFLDAGSGESKKVNPRMRRGAWKTA